VPQIDCRAFRSSYILQSAPKIFFIENPPYYSFRNVKCHAMHNAHALLKSNLAFSCIFHNSVVYFPRNFLAGPRSGFSTGSNSEGQRTL
jgi:hypothetical protein